MRYLHKAQDTLAMLEQMGFINEMNALGRIEIEGYLHHAVRQIGPTRRRGMLGETIPHAETVFSIFEPHTASISQGKARVPVELGVKVCILEDQHQFILQHQLMQKNTDDQVAVSMMAEVQKRFPELHACSLDQGLHAPANQLELQGHLDQVGLPSKGKLSQPAQAVAPADGFVNARRQHSAVASALNVLEVHGLERCPDHGINGCRRYVALAVVARNSHRIGAILWQREQGREQRKRKYSDRAATYKLAA